MKKFITIIFSFLLLFSLSSCGLKKDIKEIKMPSGEKWDEDDIEDYLEGFKEYLEQLEDTPEKTVSQWYSVSGDFIVEQKDEDDSDNWTKALVNVSGKIYDSAYAFERKAKITIKAKAEASYKSSDDEEAELSDIDAKATIIYVKGVAYVAVETKTKTESETTTEKRYMKGDLDDMSFGIDEIGDLGGLLGSNVSITEGLKTALYSALESLKSYFEANDETIDIELLKTKAGFASTIEYKPAKEETNKTKYNAQVVWEVDSKKYTTKKIEVYLDYSLGKEQQIEGHVVIKKARTGSVSAPSNLDKYEEA